MMKAAMALIAMLATGADLPRLDGARLRPGEACYAIMRNGVAIGATLQIIRASREAGRPSWDIVVHQRHNDGGFDMRDHFVLDRTSLLPMTMDSQRGVDPAAKGWHRVIVRYADSHVTGSKETASGVTYIDTALVSPAWDGNLWGVTFAALPLKVGSHYRLPNWQYDKGAGTFIVDVVGVEAIETPGGKEMAWALDAGDDPARLIRYYISRHRRLELGYRAGPFEQKLGGDCSAMKTLPVR